MKDKRTHCGAVDKSYLEQQTYSRVLISWIVRKPGPTLPPLVYGRQAGWLAGRLADKIWVNFETFKILYRLKYSDFRYAGHRLVLAWFLKIDPVWIVSMCVHVSVCVCVCVCVCVPVPKAINN